MSNQTRGGRINRINPLIQKIISSALLRSSDPILNKATITHVSTSPDLKKSMVFVSTLDGNEGSLKNSLEKNRINPLIQKIISSALLRNSDPVLNKATITHVSTSPDLKKSMVFVSTLDGNEGSLKTALEKNRTKIQKVLAREMTTKNVPKIIFEVDSTFNNVLRINEILDRTAENE